MSTFGDLNVTFLTLCYDPPVNSLSQCMAHVRHRNTPISRSFENKYNLKQIHEHNTDMTTLSYLTMAPQRMVNPKSGLIKENKD